MDTEAVRTGWKEFFSLWDWDTRLDLTFRKIASERQALRKVKALLKEIEKTYKLKLAGFILLTGLTSVERRIHVHILILSDTKWKKTLSDLGSFRLRALEQCFWEHGTCKIKVNKERFSHFYNDKAKTTSQDLGNYLTHEWNMSFYYDENYRLKPHRETLLKQLQKQ